MGNEKALARNIEPKYEDIRCVYFAIPGGMGDEAAISIVSVGRRGAEWRNYNLYQESEEERFGLIFPPFKDLGWAVAYNGVRDIGWHSIGLSACHYLLVHDSIADEIKQYSRVCEVRCRRNPKWAFVYRWQTAVDFIVSVSGPAAVEAK